MGEPLFDWLSERSAGVLLHPTSLPSDTGIGNLGDAAHRFVDFMEAAGLSVWQMCPLGPTGFGDSPYQCFSAFAANPYLIDLHPLSDAGLLSPDELGPLRALPRNHVDYGALYEAFWPILRTAWERFRAGGRDALLDYGSLREFRRAQSDWIEDYAKFMALKNHFGGRPWTEWPESCRTREDAEASGYSEDVLDDAESQVFMQYVAFAQLRRLRAYAAERGVQLMGDAPIFVAYDSADVWSRPELFELDASKRPAAVAGVPPDYFSSEGQLWGNPLYAWERHREEGYAWWIARIRSNLEFFDILRLDHFRGFASYWKVPADATTARNGEWVAGPGAELFRAVGEACPDARLVVEDLGVVTDDVVNLLEATGLPGMAVLQFAFGGDAGNPYLPHNHARNMVAYTGTHDNNTTHGWYEAANEALRDHVRRYLSVPGESIAWDFIRAVYRSTARMAIVPLQDFMSLGAEARLNTPGVPSGNWQWRFRPEQLDRLGHESAGYLRDMAVLYGRLSQSGRDGE